MDEILYRLCRHEVNIMDGWHPFPATLIAEMLNMSVHKVRYHLRKLKQQGLVFSFYEGGMTDDGEVFCLHGWGVTSEGEKTAEYQKAYEEHRKLCLECFDIDVGAWKKMRG